MRYLKVYFSVLFLSLLTLQVIQAQWAVKVQMGLTPFVTNGGNFYIAYVDESPSRDHLTNEVYLAPKKSAFSFEFGAEYLSDALWYLEGGFQFIIGSPANGFQFNLGGGYQLEKGKFIIRPGAVLSIGDAGVKLGDLYQNAEWITVNNTDFYSESVSIKLTRDHIAFQPKVYFGYPVSNSTDLYANLGFQFPLSIGTNYLYFSGQDKNGDDVSAKESIFADNVYLSLNDSQITSNFIKITGLVFNFGIRFKLD